MHDEINDLDKFLSEVERNTPMWSQKNAEDTGHINNSDYQGNQYTKELEPPPNKPTSDPHESQLHNRLQELGGVDEESVTASFFLPKRSKKIPLKKLYKPQQPFALTDLGNGERFSYAFAGDVRFLSSRERWYIWDGKRYKEDKINMHRTLSYKLIRCIPEEAKRTRDKELKREIERFAKKCESKAKTNSMSYMAQALHEPKMIPVLEENLDENPWLLNVENGTIDLNKQSIHTHKKDDLLTKKATAKYDPNAACPKWIQFLNDIMEDDQEKIYYLQQIAGIALTGTVSQQAFFLFFGNGANGKSTFIQVLQGLLADYGASAEFSTFLAQRNKNGPRDDLYVLRGVRLVTAVEPNKGQRLDESFIKSVTGGDTIKARPLFGEYIEFTPQFTLILAANDKPIIKGQDKGIWRRVKLIPFKVSIPPERRIDDFHRILLQEESSGILNWCLQGYFNYRKHGLVEPKSVTEAVEEYKDDMDIIGQFIRDHINLTRKEEDLISKDELYKKYCDWADNSGIKGKVKKQTLSKDLISRGWQETRTKISGERRRCWTGIQLIELEDHQ